MMHYRLEKRPEPSKLMLYGTPVAAVILTMILGCLRGAGNLPDAADQSL
jgi:simple sugar transport system permease protein